MIGLEMIGLNMIRLEMIGLYMIGLEMIGCHNFHLTFYSYYSKLSDKFNLFHVKYIITV